MIKSINDYYKSSDISLFIECQTINRLNLAFQLDNTLKKFYKNMCVGEYETANDFQDAVKIWDLNNSYWLSELKKTTEYDYNAIENYDRNEEYKLEKSFGDTSETLSENTTNAVTAFDSNSFVDDTLSNHDVTNHITTKNADSDIFYSRIHGNVGITTTQAMIKEQREIIDFNIVNEIISRLINDLFIG